MLRSLLTRLFHVILRAFYRRIEVIGIEKVPREGGVVFAVNHPNGLIDPLFVFCYAPRDVSFLAKAPLFDLPVIGWFTRALDSIPVYRRQDATSGSNAETFQAARSILQRGGGIAIFPEGTTHSDPQTRELKTGAARIALGASRGAAVPVVVVPAGIYYAEKGTFRSDALVAFGLPIPVEPAVLDEEGEPAADAVRRLTGAIDSALRAVTLQADSHAALELIATAEAIFSADEPPRVSAEFTLRRQFVDGYGFLREHDPQRFERLAADIRRFAAELGRSRLEPHELTPRFRPAVVFTVLILLPLASIGAVLHYPAYRLIRFLSVRYSKGEYEMAATTKALGAMLFYPLTWAVIAIVAEWEFGTAAALASLVVVPLLGWTAIRVFERLDTLVGRLRAMLRRDRYRRLLEERDAIRREILSVGEEMEQRDER